MSQYQMNMRPAFGSRPSSFGAVDWWSSKDDFDYDSESIDFMKVAYFEKYQQTVSEGLLRDYSTSPMGYKSSIKNWVDNHPPVGGGIPTALPPSVTQPSANNMQQQPNQNPVGVINGQTIQLPSQAPSSSFGSGVGVPAKPWYMVPTNQAYLALAALAVIGAVVYSQQRR